MLGKLQARIAATAAARAKAIATRREPITGTSEFAHLAEVAPEVLATVPPPPPKPVKARATIAPETDGAIAALLGGAARTDIMPDAAGALEAAPLTSHRLSEPFEALRDRADAIRAESGRAPEVTLITLGPLADHAARLAFTRNLFAAGGIESNVIALSEATARQGLLCLVGSDGAYAAEGAAAATALKGGDRTIWLAGRPGESEQALTEAGVARFVYMGCDVINCLTEALELTA